MIKSEKLTEFRQQAYLLGRYLRQYKENGEYDSRAEELVNRGLLLRQQFPEEEDPIGFLLHMMSRDEVYEAYDRKHCPILIYKSDPICYGVLNSFADEIAKNLDAMGYLVEIHEVLPGREEELLQYTSLRFRAIIGIQTYAFSIRLGDGRNLHDTMEGPKYNLIFDHPVWLKNHLENAPKDLYVITHDRNYVSFVEKYFPEVKGTFLIPPGGALYPREVEKKYPLTFVGSYHDPCLWQEEFVKANEASNGIAALFLEEAKAHRKQTWEASLQKVVAAKVQRGEMQELSPREFRELLFLVKPVCFIVMCQIREQIIEQILGSGIELHVFGDSWRHEHWKGYSGLILHPQVTPEESLKVYRQSKLSLNIMSWHKDSMTERVANMMINRCLVVSDESGYLVERYGGEEPDMLLFDLEKIRELPGQIRYYLEHDNKRRATVERAYQKAIQDETWEKRTGEIVKAIKNSCVYL